MKTFPLAPLIKLRAHAVDDCRETLQEKDVELLQAHQAVAQAENAQRQHGARRNAVQQREAVLMRAGRLTAEDLNQLSNYEFGARAEAFRLRQNNQAQAQKVQHAERARADAEQALLQARAEQRVIGRQHERFVQNQHNERETSAEEDALEVWQVRKVQC